MVDFVECGACRGIWRARCLRQPTISIYYTMYMCATTIYFFLFRLAAICLWPMVAAVAIYLSILNAYNRFRFFAVYNCRLTWIKCASLRFGCWNFNVHVFSGRGLRVIFVCSARVIEIAQIRRNTCRENILRVSFSAHFLWKKWSASDRLLLISDKLLVLH